MENATIVIRARTRGGPSLLDEIRELWRYKHLVRVLVERELRVRYKNSAIGVFWSLINPLVQVFVITVAIGFILNAGPSSLSAYVLCSFWHGTCFKPPSWTRRLRY